MMKTNVKHLVNLEQSEFEKMTLNQQYGLVDQLVGMVINLDRSAAITMLPRMDGCANAWRQYQVVAKWLRPHVTGA